jgi:hypothetical protein
MTVARRRERQSAVANATDHVLGMQRRSRSRTIARVASIANPSRVGVA